MPATGRGGRRRRGELAWCTHLRQGHAAPLGRSQRKEQHRHGAGRGEAPGMHTECSTSSAGSTGLSAALRSLSCLHTRMVLIPGTQRPPLSSTGPSGGSAHSLEHYVHCGVTGKKPPAQEKGRPGGRALAQRRAAKVGQNSSWILLPNQEVKLGRRDTSTGRAKGTALW